jgi:acetoin utilization deacetylase AcuC-like enzyme
LEDTVASPKSFEVALLAVGGTLQAVNVVNKNKFENAFALVRPPGHHAGRFQACGFCIFNNVAIAARYLLERVGLKRILVLDIDAHHGNGTQEIFYETSKVLYVSVHQDPCLFPGTGFIGEVGKGEGEGYKVNVPLPFGTEDQVYLRALKEIAVPIARQYKPQFVLVSAGLDGHYTDPVGNLSLTTRCYETIFQMIVDVASETCEGKLVAVLEGGYSLRAVGKIAATAIARMSGTAYAANDTVPVASGKTRMLGESIIEDAKKVQRSFWKLS